MTVRPNKGRLEGKVAIVTGAGSRGSGIGNGRAAAILLAREGAKVALLDDCVDAARETARLIEGEHGTCIPVEADVSSPRSCEASVATARRAWGRIDVLVNNVGVIGPSGTATEVDIAAWDEAMSVNVSSMVLMAKYAIPEMRRNAGGSIINIASVAGLNGGYPGLFYPTSKAAIINMTRAMAAHHGREGIRVNCVAPGAVYTPMVAGEMAPEIREARRRRSLLGTEGTGWDVGQAVVFLACEEARWITGVILPVDGGVTAAMPHPSMIHSHDQVNTRRSP